MEYYIYMTNDCNLNCQYCSVLFDVEKYHIPLEPSYSMDTLIGFIAKTQQELHESEATIFFFGGEPSMKYDLIYRYMEALKNGLKDISLKFVLHTNGLLLAEIPLQIIQELSLVTLSINYEKIPKYNLHNSYFSKIMDGIKFVRANSNTPISVRYTVTEDTSLYTEVKLFSSLCEYSYWQIENCAEFNDFQRFYETFTYETGLLFDEWLAKLKQGELLNYIPFMAVLKYMFCSDEDNGEFRCGYGTHQIYVQTDGHCYACCDSVAEGTHSMGDIEKGIKLFSCRVDDAPYCKQCSYRHYCMGRCGRMHVDMNEQHIREYCKLNTYMYELFKQHHAEIEKAIRGNEALKTRLNNWFLDITELVP